MLDHYVQVGVMELPTLGALFGSAAHVVIFVGLVLNAVLHRVFVARGLRWMHFVMPVFAALGLLWLYPQFDSHLMFGFIVILVGAAFIGPATDDVGAVVVSRDCGVGELAR